MKLEEPQYQVPSVQLLIENLELLGISSSHCSVGYDLDKYYVTKRLKGRKLLEGD